MENKELAVVSQLAIITDRLEEVSQDIKFRTTKAMTLVCDEENLANIKKVRASLNAEFKQYEELRKTIKKKIMENYENFEKRYNDLIGNTFKTSDNELKDKITEVEDNIKFQKRDNLIFYFNELMESKGMTGMFDFYALNIKIGMSDSMKKLMTQVNDKVESIEKDIKLIEMEDDKVLGGTILAEYIKNGFDYSLAKYTILNALKEQERLEELRQQRLQQEEIGQKIEEKVNQEIVPVEIVDKLVENFTMRFEVKGTKEQLKSLKQFMQDNKIGFNSL